MNNSTRTFSHTVYELLQYTQADIEELISFCPDKDADEIRKLAYITRFGKIENMSMNTADEIADFFCLELSDILTCNDFNKLYSKFHKNVKSQIKKLKNDNQNVEEFYKSRFPILLKN